MNRTKLFNSFDYILLFSVIILAVLGIAFIYSSGVNQDGIQASNQYIKQIIWFSIGFILMIIMALVDYRKLYRYSISAYVAICIVLLLIPFLGHTSHNATSWIGFKNFGIQPSELGKIIFIFMLAKYLYSSKNEKPLKRFIISCIIMFIPMGLILIQPDLGTASVYFPIFLLMCLMADVSIEYLILITSTLALTVVLGVLPVWEKEIVRHSIPAISILTNFKLRLLFIIAVSGCALIGLLGYIFFRKRYFYWITFVFSILAVSLIFSIVETKVLHEYQIKRLIIFLNPEVDPERYGYHIIQSKIAIGSGKLFGRGFLKGTQSHSGFLPEQSTDFIFSICAEELGFIGGVLIFLVFLGILVRTIYIMKQTNNDFGCFICAGIFGMLFFHFIVNAGMVMGIMPITGIPFPFVSYGGSALLTNMLAIGILMSINSRRLDFYSII